MGAKTRSKILELVHRVEESDWDMEIKVDFLMYMISHLASNAVEEERKAYRDRNAVVSALSKLYPAYLCRDGEGYVVTVELPTGQVGWHLADADLFMFERLRLEASRYDGHTNEEKERRLLALPARKESHT